MESNAGQETEKDTVYKEGFQSIVTLLLAITVVFYGTFVSQTLWNWFVPRLGGPKIGFLLMMGIGLLIADLTHQYQHKKRTAEETLRTCGGILLRDTVALGIGYLVYLGLR